MAAFKDFIEQESFIEFIFNEFNGGAMATGSMVKTEKPWSAKKSEILQMWKNLRPDTPIILQPISQKMDSDSQTSYGEDGIRITGSWYFISSILARLKELTYYENPQMKLRLIFRGVDKSRVSRPNVQSFVFYLNGENRARGKAGRPKKLAATPSI